MGYENWEREGVITKLLWVHQEQTEPDWQHFSLRDVTYRFHQGNISNIKYLGPQNSLTSLVKHVKKKKVQCLEKYID